MGSVSSLHQAQKVMLLLAMDGMLRSIRVEKVKMNWAFAMAQTAHLAEVAVHAAGLQGVRFTDCTLSDGWSICSPCWSCSHLLALQGICCNQLKSVQ